MGDKGLFDVELCESSGNIVRTPRGQVLEVKEPATGAKLLTGRKVKEVEKMKIDPAETEKNLVEGFVKMGLSDESALVAARGSDGAAVKAPADAPVEERLVEGFKRLGLSDSAARVAAKGRV
jgi:hypothetical protein